jgi:hypothetical protein
MRLVAQGRLNVVVDVVAELLLGDWRRDHARRAPLVDALIAELRVGSTSSELRDDVAEVVERCLPAFHALTLRSIPFTKLMRMRNGMFCPGPGSAGDAEVPPAHAAAKADLHERLRHLSPILGDVPAEKRIRADWAEWSTWYVAACERPYRSEADLTMFTWQFLKGRLPEVSLDDIMAKDWQRWTWEEDGVVRFLDFREELAIVRDYGIQDLCIPPQPLCLDALWEDCPIPRARIYRAPNEFVAPRQQCIPSAPPDHCAWLDLIGWPERTFTADDG